MIGYTPHSFVVHHSAGLAGFEQIRRHHIDGNRWSEIGYNFVVERDGELEYGRPIGTRPAANGAGNNAGTVAICAVGNNLLADQMWTIQQIATLQRVWGAMQALFPGIELKGHRDLKATDCPGCEIRAILR